MAWSTTKATTATGSPMKKVPRQPSGESTTTPPISGPLTVASANDGADVAGVAAALARRDHRGDHDLDQRGQAADAEALDDAGADQHLHATARASRCTEPIEKMTSADCTSSFLENRSASLPQIGVVAVIASRVATTTQV